MNALISGGRRELAWGSGIRDEVSHGHEYLPAKISEVHFYTGTSRHPDYGLEPLAYTGKSLGLSLQYTGAGGSKARTSNQFIARHAESCDPVALE